MRRSGLRPRGQKEGCRRLQHGLVTRIRAVRPRPVNNEVGESESTGTPGSVLKVGDARQRVRAGRIERQVPVDRCRIAAGRGERIVKPPIPVAEVWNGSAWTVQAPSVSTDILGSGILSAVSCSSSSHCMAVGAGATRPISEELTAGTWTSVPTAQVSRTPFASLYQVSCPTATRCIAVGARTDGSPGDIGTSLAEEWNGSSWRVLKTRNP
jgi:hypothetical protein